MERCVWFSIKSLICVFVASVVLQPASLHGTNHVCSNFIELKKTVEGLIGGGSIKPEDTIILFDVADTLITTKRDFCGISKKLERMFPLRLSDL